MQKFILENLDCNSCAKKLEKALQALPSVSQATINFSTNTLYLQASDISAVKAQIAKIEPNINMLSMHDKAHTNTSYLKELSKLCVLLSGFLICMLCLHYTPIENSVYIQKLNAFFAIDSKLFQESLINGKDSILYSYLANATPFSLILHVILVLLYIISGMPIFQAVWRNVRNRVFFDEHTLMFIATIAAFCIGEMSEAVAVMLFFRIGEFLESLALKKSKKSLYGLLDITPEIAHIQKQDKDSKEIIWEDTHAELLNVNDIILVKVGEKIPVDGIIRHGASVLDMQALSGESKPISVKEGDEVLAGAINMQGVLTICVSKPFCDSQIAKIKEMVEQASNTKAKSEKIITRFAQVYTPIMFFIALAIACLPPLFNGEWHEWIYRGLVVLMVSCPCALVLSIPLGYFGALGIASRRGILIKGSMHFDNLSKLQNIIFDKTGTLTQGIFQIQSIVPLANENKESLLDIARHAQRFSNHPIAHAIMKGVEHKYTCHSKTFQEIAGKGVYMECCNDCIIVGNLSLMKDYNIDTSLFNTHRGQVLEGVSIAHIAKNGIYMGYITLGDTLKEDSKKCMEYLRRLKVSPIAILSGDNKQSVAHIAKELDIQNYYAELLPTQKAEKLQILMQQNKDSTQPNKHAITAFVGDGINDCVVLKSADIGISIGTKNSHSDINKESADIILTNPSPMGIVHAIKIARKIQRITWQNIAFTLGTKLILVLLGVVGIANMWLAVFGDVGVALLALLNALRVARI